jgi:hypothetical protein
MYQGMNFLNFSNITTIGGSYRIGTDNLHIIIIHCGIEYPRAMLLLE